MNATLDRLTTQFVQLIGPAAMAPSVPATVASTSVPAAAAPSGAGLKPGLPASEPTAVAPAGTVPSAPASAASTPVAAAAAPSAAGLRPALPGSAAPGAPTAKPAPAATPLPPPPPVQVLDHALKGFQFDASVSPDQVVAAAVIMDREGFALDAVTGVDWLAQSQMEVVYDYFHPIDGLRAVVRTRVNRAEPELPTISPVFPGANWHERETHDFYGIRFTGHPNLTPFLLPEDANFHPLRKDYQP